jgi:lincosamide nucleotidyltransferase A/C/D/E
MTSAALLEVLQLIESAGITVWLDGGWGVDALLRTQTRDHQDLDLIVAVADVPMLQEALATAGFAFRDGTPPSSFVLADGRGLEVDVHAVTFDDGGNGIYRMQNGEDWIYPAEGFSGRGLIGSETVKCLSPSAQVLCHAHGYQLVAKDFHDMELLARQFAIDLPPQLRRRPADDSMS